MVTLARDNAALAQAYDTLSNSQFRTGNTLLDWLEIRPDDVFLDIGCGTGRLALSLLARPGFRGRVLGIDPLAERIQIARAKDSKRRAEFRVGVAEDLAFLSNESVDVICLSSVFHWITDQPRALSEFLRVLKPGGRIGISTGAHELAHITTHRSVTDAVLTREPYRDLVNVNEHATAKSGVTTTQLIELLLDTGFEVQHVEVRSRSHRYVDGGEVVTFLESSTFGNFLEHVPEELRERARLEIAAEFDALRKHDGIDLIGYTILALAKKHSAGIIA